MTRCTAETRVALIDRASSTPPLWDLRKSVPTGGSELWLALSDPQTGSHRVIFKNPAEADADHVHLLQHVIPIDRWTKQICHRLKRQQGKLLNREDLALYEIAEIVDDHGCPPRLR